MIVFMNNKDYNTTMRDEMLTEWSRGVNESHRSNEYK